MNRSPQRIVCLSAEAADWYWRIGAWEKVAGITAFFEPPTGAPARPRVSGFNSANLPQIEKLHPDLIVTFSDVQAELAAELIRRGFPVLATNQHTLDEIETTLALLARLVGRESEGKRWLSEFRTRLTPVDPALRPRVYFEEWNEPLVAGIAWVSELIERAGGQDIFVELRQARGASGRVVLPEQVCLANPEIILASWCGRPVDAAQIAQRPGWHTLAAVQAGRIHEICGEDILQPGFRLIHGFEQIKQIIAALA